jgi:glycosyltransferase involved in cell wall biosynthesis
MSANDIHLHYDVVFESECSNTLLSIIIPILNAERYVKKFIEYIKSEKLIVSNNSIEFIFIDGGSQDETLNLILKYIAKEGLCGKVVYAKGAEVSTSRNIGIELSKGEYVVFADIDDVPVLRGFIIASHYAKIYDVNVAFGKLVIFNEKGNVIYETPFNELTRISGKDLLLQIRKSHCQSYYKALDLRFQQGLYQRHFLLRENIRFTPGTISHEDFEFLIKVLLRASSILTIPILTYIYFARSASIRFERFLNGLKTLERVCKLLDDISWCYMMLLQDLSSVLDHYLYSKLIRFELDRKLQLFIQLNYDTLSTYYYIYLCHLMRFCLGENYLSLDEAFNVFKTLLKYILIRIFHYLKR